MTKVVVLFAVILFTRLLSFAQPDSINRLESLLKLTKGDTIRINILNQLSDRYLAYQPLQARKYAEEALTLSRTLNFSSGEVSALNILGDYEFRQSNYAQAVEYATQSLKLAEQHHDSIGMGMAYRVLGISHTFGFRQGIYPTIGSKY